RPTPDDAGEQQVILRVRDGRGGVDLQSYRVTVRAGGSPPVFSTPAPAAPAVVGLPYQHQFRTQDADGDAVTYRLDAFPAGMTVDPITGLLGWIPSAAQAGTHDVTVTALDGPPGNRSSLSFALQVLAAAPNDPPAITSAPRTSIGLGATYLYQVRASDPNNDPL